MKIKPTLRELRVAVKALDLDMCFEGKIFNDQHVNGGRIKVWGEKLDVVSMSKLEEFLQNMFPMLTMSVYNWKGTCTCIKFAEALPSQRHDW
jgi:hypothetical protein